MNLNKPNLIPVPAIPADWIHNTTIRIESGYKPRCIVLHKVNGYHPFCVHLAYVDGDQWVYESGSYGKTLEEGEKAFAERSKGW